MVKNVQNDTDTTVEQLKGRVREFVHDRTWERYHNPKDVAESICIEAAELLELFQWVCADEALSWRQDPSKMKCIQEELADIVIYGLSMANTMKIDVTAAILKKLKIDEVKYPVDKFLGKAHAL